jgi:hypothetical protein
LGIREAQFKFLVAWILGLNEISSGMMPIARKSTWAVRAIRDNPGSLNNDPDFVIFSRCFGAFFRWFGIKYRVAAGPPTSGHASRRKP